MKLDSVREAKDRAVQDLRQSLDDSPRRISPFGLAARSIESVDPIQRTIAVGVHPAGPGDYKVAVRVQRQGLQHTAYVERIEETAKGEVDVRYVGRIVKRAGPDLRSRLRPLIIGSSIGHVAITAGTLGCFVRDGEGRTLMLSNNHVLANENQGVPGDAIIQPGVFDGGSKDNDSVGSLEAFVEMKADESNRVDCAVATIAKDMEIDPSALADFGSLAGVASGLPEEEQGVEKIGRTTGHTAGRITAFELDNIVVEYDIGNLRFDSQIEIEGAEQDPFSRGGDSGSLIFTSADRLGLALLFAGGDQGGTNGMGLTYANPLGAILASLMVELVT